MCVSLENWNEYTYKPFKPFQYVWKMAYIVAGPSHCSSPQAQEVCMAGGRPVA